jgi:hypothetical protein
MGCRDCTSHCRSAKFITHTMIALATLRHDTSSSLDLWYCSIRFVSSRLITNHQTQRGSRRSSAYPTHHRIQKSLAQDCHALRRCVLFGIAIFVWCGKLRPVRPCFDLACIECWNNQMVITFKGCHYSFRYFCTNFLYPSPLLQTAPTRNGSPFSALRQMSKRTDIQ